MLGAVVAGGVVVGVVVGVVDGGGLLASGGSAPSPGWVPPLAGAAGVSVDPAALGAAAAHHWARGEALDALSVTTVVPSGAASAVSPETSDDADVAPNAMAPLISEAVTAMEAARAERFGIDGIPYAKHFLTEVVSAVGFRGLNPRERQIVFKAHNPTLGGLGVSRGREGGRPGGRRGDGPACGRRERSP